MRRTRHLLTAVAATSLALGLSACSVPSDSAAPGASGAGTAAGGSGGGSGSKLVGVVSISANEGANARVIQGVTEAATAQGWTVEVVDAAGDADVLALTYRGGQVCRDREAIFDEMVAQEPGLRVTKEEVTIPGFLQDGARYATAWLAAHPAGSGNLAIWGCWEDPTLGAVSALAQQGRTDVLTYGINGSSTAIQAVQDGSLTATVYEDSVSEGRTMFDTTLEAIAAGAAWEPQTIDVPSVLVTADTVEQFVAEHPEALQ